MTTEECFRKQNIITNPEQPYHVYLGDGMFVIITTNYEDVYVKLQAFNCIQDKFAPLESQVALKVHDWDILSTAMDLDLKECFIIPKTLFIYVKDNSYYLQEMFEKDNYHRFKRFKCCLNDSQWNCLKSNRSKIADLIVFYMFEKLFADLLKKEYRGKNYYISDDESLKESFCDMVLERIKPNIPNNQWNVYFHSAVYNINVVELAKCFWKKHHSMFDISNCLKDLFHHIYNKFLTIV